MRDLGSEELEGISDCIEQIKSFGRSHIIESKNGEISAFVTYEIVDSESCNEIGLYNSYDDAFQLTAEYREPEESYEEFAEKIMRPRGDCKDGRKHHWEDGWVCKKCGKRRADYVEERSLCKVQYRDVEYFLSLLTYHECELLDQIEKTDNELLKRTLDQELVKCRGIFARMLKVESVKR